MQIADAICDHLRGGGNERPLVISVHGPPGVGKSFLHSVLADALFVDERNQASSYGGHAPFALWPRNDTPLGSGTSAGADGTGARVDVDGERPWLFGRRCTRSLCPAYRILFGTSYLSDDADRKFSELRHNLVRHVRGYRESLVVIEEYDKMDCRSRGLLKELIDYALAEKIQWGRSIVILESNTGYLQLMQLLGGDKVGTTHALSDSGKEDDHPRMEAGSSRHDDAEELTTACMQAEEAQKLLKDLVFDTWRKNDIRDCREDRVRTLKTIGMIDIFVPFFPLSERDIRELFEMLLRMRQHVEVVQRRSVRGMSWDDDVATFLASRVEYEAGFAIEGAKEGRATMSRHVTRAIHAWNTTISTEGTLSDDSLPSIRLKLSPDGTKIVCGSTALDGAPS